MEGRVGGVTSHLRMAEMAQNGCRPQARPAHLLIKIHHAPTLVEAGDPGKPFPRHLPDGADIIDGEIARFEDRQHGIAVAIRGVGAAGEIVGLPVPPPGERADAAGLKWGNKSGTVAKALSIV